MTHTQRKNTANSLLILAVMTAILIALGRDAVRASNPFIYATWLEEPNLSVSYMWNLYERRDGWYIENWSEDQLAGVDGFEFGVREVFKAMKLSDLIDAQHDGDAWIQLYNVATNDPEGSHDFPPHMNIISYWGETGKEYPGDINGHFYTTVTGEIDIEATWYAWHVGPDCEAGVRNPAVDTWVSHIDRNCALMWQERVTSAGEIELRRDPDSSIYTVRSQAPGHMHILRDGELLRSVERTFHDAWINYPSPYPDGMAKVIWEIRDFEAERLITETIIARPDTGRLVSHEREETLLDGSSPNAEMLYLPQIQN